MGKTQSKSHVEHKNDPQIRIINNQSTHTELIENLEVYLMVILVLVAIQLALTMYQTFKRYTNSKAIKKAKSMVALNEITVQK